MTEAWGENMKTNEPHTTHDTAYGAPTVRAGVDTHRIADGQYAICPPPPNPHPPHDAPPHGGPHRQPKPQLTHSRTYNTNKTDLLYYTLI
ncbi:hypothetical protein R80B4_01547 [Fibrobacteres bacterium R8-0-B4]